MKNIHSNKRFLQESRKIYIFSAFLVLIIFTIFFLLTSGKIVNNLAEVHFIDVGQGDAVFIKLKSANILIDGGERDSIVSDYLKANLIKTLDIVVSTHPHSDHIGGLINILENFNVKEVIDPSVAHTTKTFEDYLTLIDNKNIKFTEGRAGIKRTYGNDITFNILHPENPSEKHLNDASVVVKLIVKNVSFLFTGDAELNSENEMLLSSQSLLQSNILKAGHHGSRTSTSERFLNAVKPEAAVISCGADNKYSHPHSETLHRLHSRNILIYRTDLHGHIIISTDGKNYNVNISKSFIPEKRSNIDSVSNILEIVGSSRSDKYHISSCRHAANINPENLIKFNSAEDAETKGYTECGVCKPKGR